MPKRKKYGYHLDCVDCDKHYCLSSMGSQVFLAAKHHECTKVMSLGRNECEDACNDK